MNNIEKEQILYNTIDYEIALNGSYEFIKSKGLEQDYKAQLDIAESSIIERIDIINDYTGF